jgi:hypothetical protein
VKTAKINVKEIGDAVQQYMIENNNECPQRHGGPRGQEEPQPGDQGSLGQGLHHQVPRPERHGRGRRHLLGPRQARRDRGTTSSPGSSGCG